MHDALGPEKVRASPLIETTHRRRKSLKIPKNPSTEIVTKKEPSVCDDDQNSNQIFSDDPEKSYHEQSQDLVLKPLQQHIQSCIDFYEKQTSEDHEATQKDTSIASEQRGAAECHAADVGQPKDHPMFSDMPLATVGKNKLKFLCNPASLSVRRSRSMSILSSYRRTLSASLQHSLVENRAARAHRPPKVLCNQMLSRVHVLCMANREKARLYEDINLASQICVHLLHDIHSLLDAARRSDSSLFTKAENIDLFVEHPLGVVPDYLDF